MFKMLPGCLAAVVICALAYGATAAEKPKSKDGGASGSGAGTGSGTANKQGGSSSSGSSSGGSVIQKNGGGSGPLIQGGGTTSGGPPISAKQPPAGAQPLKLEKPLSGTLSGQISGGAGGSTATKVIQGSGGAGTTTILQPPKFPFPSPGGPGSGLSKPTTAGAIVFPSRSHGDFSVGGAGLYLGGGKWDYSHERYYHPKYGWYRPTDLNCIESPRLGISIYAPPIFYSPPPYVPRELELVRRPVLDVSREATAEARRLIDNGDMRFREGLVSEALRRYKLAGETASGYAEAYQRQALALSALGRYDEALAMFHLAIDLDPQWHQSEFRLVRIYAEPKAKEDVIETLARRALDRPNDPGAYVLLAMHLQFDGQADRAERLFNHALELEKKNRAVSPPAAGRDFDL